MKVQPIPEELWRALNVVGHELNDAINNMSVAEGDFSDKEIKAFELLKDSAELISEYASCFNAKGEVSQRGRNPHCWNEDTIFTPYEDTKHYNDNEDDFEGSEETDTSRNQTVSEDA